MYNSEDKFIRGSAIINALERALDGYRNVIKDQNPWQDDYRENLGAIGALLDMKEWLEIQIKIQEKG